MNAKKRIEVMLFKRWRVARINGRKRDFLLNFRRVFITKFGRGLE